MSINMNDYNVIYEGVIYPCVQINPQLYFENIPNGEVQKPIVERIQVVYLDTANRLKVVMDEGTKFQFIRK